jgi:nicotinate-nucleotide adenylyltransferase
MHNSQKKSYQCENIGLYFGSFNPVHIGHLVIANYIVEFTEIGQLWFVVSPHNPHKKKAGLLNDFDRLEMVNLAIEGDERLQVCDIEFYLPKPSYTVDTLAYLTDRYPSYNFRIIMGSDNLKNFHKWKNYETIINNYGIIIYPRPGFSCEGCESYPDITVTKAPQMDISSSFIRKAINKGKDVRHFLPLPVWKYIDKKGFYINSQANS